MRNLRTALFSALATLTLAGPMALAADHASSSHCIFHELGVSAVRPYRELERPGKSELRRLRGAELDVPAAPGLTGEWLRTTLGRHIADMKTGDMEGCALDVAKIEVRVTSSSTGFVVTIRTDDDARAAEVLRRAERLLPR